MGKNLFTIVGLMVLVSSALVEGIGLSSRRWASCVYVGGQIYCYGGLTSLRNDNPADTNLYSLNVAQFSDQPIDSMRDKWEVVQPNVPFDTESRRIPSAIALSDGKRLLINGGHNYYNKKYNNQTIVYDTTTNTWNKALPYSEGNRGLRQLHYATAVNLPNNLVGFYGGFEQLANVAIPQTTSTGATMPYYVDSGIAVGFTSIQTYSPEATNWATFNPQNNIPGNYYPDAQTATLDPTSGKVYYLGGLFYSPTQEEEKVAFSWAYTFNTKTGSWLNETLTGGVLPSKRIGHTAHLLPNSRDIIIYGGSGGKDENGQASVDYCFTLNLIDNTWTEQSNLNVPSILGGPRYSHSSVLVNTTLFILFGKGLDGQLQSSMLAIDVANISNISYSPNFGPALNNVNVVSDNNSSSSSGLSKGAIGGIAAGAAVALLAIAAAIVFCLRRKRKSKEINFPENQGKYAIEQTPMDWDKFDGQYREVSPVGWGMANSPHSTHSMDATRVGSFSPEMALNPDVYNAGVVKPSVDNSYRGYTLVKPDAK